MRTPPATQDLYERISAIDLAPLWQHARELLPPEPKASAIPQCWSYASAREALEMASAAIDPSDAERRVLLLVNPGLGGAIATTPTLLAGMQMLLPGECAPAHRHTAAAVRLIVEGSGAHTVTDGQRVSMVPGDLVITPSWTWHEHDSDASEPVVWLDALDVPLVRALECGFFELHPETRQPLGDASAETDPDPNHDVERGFLRYPWDTIAAALSLNARGSEGMVTFEYTDPMSAGPVTPTIGCRAHLLPPGQTAPGGRETASSIFHVIRGYGISLVGDAEITWTAGDTFVVPGWSVSIHRNLDESNASYLFSMNDAPALRALGLYRSA